MIDVKKEKKTYEAIIKELKEQVKFFTNKSQRLEKENKELNEQVQALAKKLVKVSESQGLIRFNLDVKKGK